LDGALGELAYGRAKARVSGREFEIQLRRYLE
jgi:hypothetical protein